jgi:hypothetical protein
MRHIRDSSKTLGDSIFLWYFVGTTWEVRLLDKLDSALQYLPAIVVICELCDNLVFPAKRTSFVLSQGEYLEIGIKGVVNEKTAYEGLSFSQNEFKGLSGLDQTNLPGHNSQDTNLASSRDKLLTGRCRHHASQAGATTLWIENACLPVELDSCAENVRFTR